MLLLAVLLATAALGQPGSACSTTKAAAEPEQTTHWPTLPTTPYQPDLWGWSNSLNHNPPPNSTFTYKPRMSRDTYMADMSAAFAKVFSNPFQAHLRKMQQDKNEAKPVDTKSSLESMKPDGNNDRKERSVESLYSFRSFLESMLAPHIDRIENDLQQAETTLDSTHSDAKEDEVNAMLGEALKEADLIRSMLNETLNEIYELDHEEIYFHPRLTRSAVPVPRETFMEAIKAMFERLEVALRERLERITIAAHKWARRNPITGNGIHGWDEDENVYKIEKRASKDEHFDFWESWVNPIGPRDDYMTRSQIVPIDHNSADVSSFVGDAADNPAYSRNRRAAVDSSNVAAAEDHPAYTRIRRGFFSRHRKCRKCDEQDEKDRKANRRRRLFVPTGFMGPRPSIAQILKHNVDPVPRR